MSDYIFALDIGTRKVIGTVGYIKDKKFIVSHEVLMEHEERAMIDGQIHDIELVAKLVKKIKDQLEKELNITLTKVSIAAAGRFLKTVEVNHEIKCEKYKDIDKDQIRGLELTTIKKAEEIANENSENILYCVGYSVKNYYLNGYVISNLEGHKGDTISVEIIATFLPRSVVDSLYAVMKKVGLTVSNLTLEPIAAMEVVIPSNLRMLNIGLVDIGAGTSDIAISRDGTIYSYGMISKAGDEITEVIAKEYLVDFNTAEKMKRRIFIDDKIKFTDVLGFEGEVERDGILKLIDSKVNELADEICNKILELNGGKSPNAMFLVGGGAHTPLLKDYMVEKLQLSDKRVVIKDRSNIESCEVKDLSLGSTGVTVLGIALEAIKRIGGDFIDISINDKVVSLFNYNNHKVMDVILASGINPKDIISKKGSNVRFTLNGRNKIAFGSLGKNAIIKINGKDATLDSEIVEGDKVNVEFAINGESAKPIVKDYVLLESTSFYYNDKIQYLEPRVYINDNRSDIDMLIKDGDDIEIIYPKTLGDFKDYYINDGELKNFYIRENIISNNYIINEGDRIYSEIKEDKLETEEIEEIENSKTNDFEANNITVTVNGEKVILSGKESYVFVDIFDKIKFDLTSNKGMLMLILNNERASFYSPLYDGDNIELKFQ
ncbi:cell division protein FtsA [Clostridium bornimense]|uniref:Cell division protein FtsA n=1 Tax=Clostridium bornimense TaxID=1216932 RepID=W6SFP7_9CLOT|nr:cell division FtsA domain-containing protein [Clostridium bornimense]CDM68510.1 cell division protein FtsA [Clostridium bornimense]